MWLADRPRVILLVIVALGLLVTALHRGPLYAGGDGPDYLAGAYHLYHDHVFSQAETPNAPLFLLGHSMDRAERRRTLFRRRTGDGTPAWRAGSRRICAVQPANE